MMEYDTVNDRFILFNITHKVPDNERRIHVYDPDANEFAKPIPVTPQELPTGFCHSFFCPELNAFFIHRAGGDNQPGNTWAYRYQRTETVAFSLVQRPAQHGFNNAVAVKGPQAGGYLRNAQSLYQRTSRRSCVAGGASFNSAKSSFSTSRAWMGAGWLPVAEAGLESRIAAQVGRRESTGGTTGSGRRGFDVCSDLRPPRVIVHRIASQRPLGKNPTLTDLAREGGGYMQANAIHFMRSCIRVASPLWRPGFSWKINRGKG